MIIIQNEYILLKTYHNWHSNIQSKLISIDFILPIYQNMQY
jgi:hypothetical protein